MLVTHIEPVTKTKYKVFIEEQFAFVLYKGELSRYQIRENQEISEEIYHTIKKEVVLKRARLRAMHLLKDMDRTEGQLREKLKQNGYPEDIIEQAVAYVKSFGYINDENYAQRFVENKKKSKSKKQIYALLYQKGLARDIIEQAMEQCYGTEDSAEAIAEILRKKRYCPDTATTEETQKICAYLMRKGFPYEAIRQVIQVSGWNA